MEPSSNEKHDTTHSILKEVAHLPKLDLGLPSYDSLFSTEEERQEANSEKVMTIPIDKITDFKEHPFHVTMDEDMAKLIDSIKENDMLMPALVRPKKDGTYEMISGHRRKFALSQLGRKEMNVIVRNLDDEQATILMVDSNIQRENIYPSERGYAYKMRLEAMKHQGKRIEEIPDDELGIEYTEEIGEAAFYGPKLDVNVTPAVGNEYTLSTCQLDFCLPMKFNLSYIDKDGSKKTPVVLHRAILGSIDRFIAYYLE